ncbi:MAG: hypothetical protein WA632_09525 [Gallionella sp.]
MNRRNFILLNCLWSIFPSLALAKPAQFAPSAALGRVTDAHRSIAQEIAALFTDLDAARAIGREYLRNYPVSGDPDALIADLEFADGHDTGASLRNRVAKLRSAEFLSGRTVVVNNWILPRIEADLCALTVLLPAGV